MNYLMLQIIFKEHYIRYLKKILKKVPILKSLFVGLEAVEKEIYEIFEKNGIIRFDSLNTKFDPERHQAVSKKESELQKV